MVWLGRHPNGSYACSIGHDTCSSPARGVTHDGHIIQQSTAFRVLMVIALLMFSFPVSLDRLAFDPYPAISTVLIASGTASIFYIEIARLLVRLFSAASVSNTLRFAANTNNRQQREAIMSIYPRVAQSRLVPIGFQNPHFRQRIRDYASRALYRAPPQARWRLAAVGFVRPDEVLARAIDPAPRRMANHGPGLRAVIAIREQVVSKVRRSRPQSSRAWKGREL
jgi:hypothetical protein